MITPDLLFIEIKNKMETTNKTIKEELKDILDVPFQDNDKVFINYLKSVIKILLKRQKEQEKILNSCLKQLKKRALK